MKYPSPRLLIAAATLVAASSANALTATKTGTAGSTDLADITGVSWSGGTGAGGSPTSDDVATWTTSSLGAGLTVGSDVTWGGINVSGALTDIGISGAGKITTGNITLTGTKTLSIANDIVLSGNSTYTITNVNGALTPPDLTLSGVISGNFGITTTGPSANNPAATIVLSGANTYSGGTLIRRYTTVSVSNIGNTTDTASALGTGEIKLFAGELTYTGSGETTDKVINFSTHPTLSETGGSITNNGTGTLTFSTAAISTLTAAGGITLGGTGNGIFVGITQSTPAQQINLNKLGTGTWTLTGSTSLNNGATNGLLNLKEGVLQLGAGDNRLTGVAALTLGAITVNTSGKLILGSAGVAGVTNSKSDLTVSELKTAGNGTANKIVGGHTSVSTLTVNQATNTTFGGTLGGAGTNENNLALTKTGTGILTLTGVNTYTGSLTLGVLGGSGGTIRVNSTAALGGGTSAIISGTSAVNATLASTAAGTLITGRSVSLTTSGGGITFGDAVGTGDMSFNNIDRLPGATDRTINVANSGQTVTFTGNFTNTTGSTLNTTFNKGGAGTLTVLGAGVGGTELGYSKITVTGGTLNGTVFTDLGVVSSFGKASYAGATGLVTLDGGAIGLVDGGSSSSTNRALQIGRTTAGGAGTIINNATSNTLAFTNAALTYGTVDQTRSLTLGGSNTGANTFATTIGDNGTGAVSLTKSGNGGWIISGNNSHTGGTTISAGTLVTENAGALGSGSVSVNTVGATLKVGNGTVNTVTLGSGANLAVADGAFIQLGALNADSLDATTGTNGVITLAGGGAYNFSSAGKLDLNGILDGAMAGSHTYNLIVGSGTVTNELQLVNISGYDTGLITLNSFANGTLTFTAVPEPSTYGLIGAGALAAVAVVRRRRKQAGKAA